MTTHFRITTLHCESCIKFCTLKLRRIAGVTSVAIDLATGDASVESEQLVPLEQLQAALAGTDYDVHAIVAVEPETQAA